jgi:hypothetical protein
MADHFYGVSDTGSNKAVTGNVTKAASTNSTKIELRVTDGQSISKARLLSALDSLKNYITTDNAPA